LGNDLSDYVNQLKGMVIEKLCYRIICLLESCRRIKSFGCCVFYCKSFD